MKVRRGATTRYPPVWTRPRAHLYSCSTPDSAKIFWWVAVLVEPERLPREWEENLIGGLGSEGWIQRPLHHRLSCCLGYAWQHYRWICLWVSGGGTSTFWQRPCYQMHISSVLSVLPSAWFRLGPQMQLRGRRQNHEGRRMVVAPMRVFAWFGGRRKWG